MTKTFRFLLLPFSWIYGAITWLRNLFFDMGILPSQYFEDVAVISVGNLLAGGTGKSPQIEYLIHLLSQKYNVATLSRGYGRTSSGFRLVDEDSLSDETGDEPIQFKRKFPAIAVAVDASRVNGIKQLKKLYPELDVILLDDAFQHRYVKPSLSILLTDMANPYFNDRVFPFGMLRESRDGAKRADIIIVTKTPENFSGILKRSMLHNLEIEQHQKAYFSFIKYGQLHVLTENDFTRSNSAEGLLSKELTIVILTGIANPAPLENYLKDKVKKINTVSYPDHHEFSAVEMMQLKDLFEKTASEKKIIITTEKDAVRLNKPGLLEIIQQLPVYYLPIAIDFSSNDKEEFNKQIMEHVKEHRGNYKAHSKQSSF